MKRLVSILGVILVMLILYPSSGLMAQDPNDPGEPDTLYFSPGTMKSPTGDTIYVWPDSFPQDMIIYINFWNDNYIAAFTVPLIDTCYGPPCSADLDSVKNNRTERPRCFEGSRVEDFGVLSFKLRDWPPKFMVAGTAMYEDPVPPGNGILATMIFTVNDTGRMCLDTLFWAPSAVLTFVTPTAQGYTPIFKHPNFVITDCQYNSGDPNQDGITNIIDVVYLINYTFRSGPPPCVLKSGDASCDGLVNVIDIVYLVGYLFKGGPAPGYCP